MSLRCWGQRVSTFWEPLIGHCLYIYVLLFTYTYIHVKLLRLAQHLKQLRDWRPVRFQDESKIGFMLAQKALILVVFPTDEEKWMVKGCFQNVLQCHTRTFTGWFKLNVDDQYSTLFNISWVHDPDRTYFITYPRAGDFLLPPSQQSAPGLGVSVRHPTHLGMASGRSDCQLFCCFIGHVLAFLVGSAFGSGTLPDFQPMLEPLILKHWSGDDVQSNWRAIW